MRIEEQELVKPCKCKNTKVDVHYEDDSIVVQAMICTKCGRDLR